MPAGGRDEPVCFLDSNQGRDLFLHADLPPSSPAAGGRAKASAGVRGVSVARGNVSCLCGQKDEVW